MSHHRKALILLAVVFLLSLSACDSKQRFSFSVIKDSLESRLQQQKALIQALPELEIKLERLKETSQLSSEKLAQEARENAEARFGIGYYYELEDYSAAEQAELKALEGEIIQLSPKLEQVFELEAQIRVLEGSPE